MLESLLFSFTTYRCVYWSAWVRWFFQQDKPTKKIKCVYFNDHQKWMNWNDQKKNWQKDSSIDTIAMTKTYFDHQLINSQRKQIFRKWFDFDRKRCWWNEWYLVTSLNQLFESTSKKSFRKTTTTKNIMSIFRRFFTFCRSLFWCVFVTIFSTCLFNEILVLCLLQCASLSHLLFYILSRQCLCMRTVFKSPQNK